MSHSTSLRRKLDFARWGGIGNCPLCYATMRAVNAEDAIERVADHLMYHSQAGSLPVKRQAAWLLRTLRDVAAGMKR